MKCKIGWFTVVVVLLTLLLPNVSLSKQEQRIALVIGNGDYKTSPLANPVNDANDMAAALERCNFTVMKTVNATRREIRRAIREFGSRIKSGGVGLFYYAGHGIQVKGENYLVPIGAEVYNEAEVEDDCLKVSSVLRQMETADNRLNIIILDACRDNPFGRSFRSSNRGLAKMDAPTGSILAYATAPGSVAADGVSRNGLFTSKILEYMIAPRLEIGKLFRQVRVAVMNASGKRQVPWESSSLTGEFYFTSERAITVKKRPPGKTEDSAELEKERERLERERQELDRLKAEIKREKLEVERKRLEAAKKKLAMVKRPPKLKAVKVNDTDTDLFKRLLGLWKKESDEFPGYRLRITGHKGNLSVKLWDSRNTAKTFSVRDISWDGKVLSFTSVYLAKNHWNSRRLTLTAPDTLSGAFIGKGGLKGKETWKKISR